MHSSISQVVCCLRRAEEEEGEEIECKDLEDFQTSFTRSTEHRHNATCVHILLHKIAFTTDPSLLRHAPSHEDDDEDRDKDVVFCISSLFNHLTIQVQRRTSQCKSPVKNPRRRV